MKVLGRYSDAQLAENKCVGTVQFSELPRRARPHALHYRHLYWCTFAYCANCSLAMIRRVVKVEKNGFRRLTHYWEEIALGAHEVEPVDPNWLRRTWHKMKGEQ